MKSQIDEEADALSLQLIDTPIVELEEVVQGLIIDYGADDQISGIIDIRQLPKRPQPINLTGIYFPTHPRRQAAA